MGDHTQRQHEARRVLEDVFGPNPASEQILEELVAQIDPDTAEGLMPARVDLAFAVVQSVVGDEAAAMPGFATWCQDSRLPGVDDFMSGMAWQICFNHATTEWLQATDPDRLRRHWSCRPSCDGPSRLQTAVVGWR